jgi:hypothetical protein
MTTITPPDFSGVAPGATALCAQGSIGAASDWGGVAMIGVNVNQAMLGADGGIPPMQTVAIGGSGITVRYGNPGGTQIRAQIQTPAGETSATVWALPRPAQGPSWLSSVRDGRTG